MADDAIPERLRTATKGVREFEAKTLDQDADDAERLAGELRRRARALRAYDRRLELGMEVQV